MAALSSKAAKDYASAATGFERACELGSGSGCILFANALMHGEGLQKDEARACELFDRMCSAGRARGCTEAGIARLAGRGHEKDAESGERLVHQGCAKGDEIGCELLSEPGLRSDVDSAFKAAAGRAFSKMEELEEKRERDRGADLQQN
jgi:TPR repeat protein